MQLLNEVPQLGAQTNELMPEDGHAPHVAEQPALAACCPNAHARQETPAGAQVHAEHVVDHRHVALHSKAWQTPQEVPPTLVVVVPGSHTPTPVQAPTRPQRHADEQVRERDPQNSQSLVSTSPAVHSPIPEQAPTAPQVQLGKHVCVRIPHRSQGVSRRSPGVHSHALHEPETQRPPAAQGVVPAQQASPRAPHPAHKPSEHVSPTLQPSPAQHDSPERPHVRQMPA